MAYHLGQIFKSVIFLHNYKTKCLKSVHKNLKSVQELLIQTKQNRVLSDNFLSGTGFIIMLYKVVQSL